MTKNDKKLANDLDYDGVEFPVREKGFSRLKERTIFALMCFIMTQTDFSNLHFKSNIWKLDRFLACNWWKQVTLYVYQRLLNLCLTKQIIKTKKSFLRYFSSKNALAERKEACLSINGAQSVKLEKGAIAFKNRFK